jgi:hypothetical protein
LLQQQQQQQLQIHHSSFQTQKTLLITPAHGLQNRRSQKCREDTARQQRREGTNARARLKIRGRRPTKGANGGAQVFLIYPPGTIPGWAGWCVSTRLSLRLPTPVRNTLPSGSLFLIPDPVDNRLVLHFQKSNNLLG